jgi:polyvinyl alcohol dehydrogenase (cytochrome)
MAIRTGGKVRPRRPALAVTLVTAIAMTLFSFAALAADQAFLEESPSGQWPIMGQNLSNTRSQPAERRIGTANVGSLAVKWTFVTGGDVSATPTVAGDAVYVPDWAGNLFAIGKQSGELLWTHKISDYDHVAGAFSRVSPAVHGDELIIGDTESESSVHNGANVIAVDRRTGNLRWITQVDSQPQAIITAPAVVYGDTVFIGVSSNEEALAINNSYPCCTFRGSVVALDARTGKLLWQTYDMPANGGQPGGYSGGAIWQPSAIDPARRLLFIGTGNNYTAPASVVACATANPTMDCTAPNDYFDTALALDLSSGQVRWAKKLGTYDVWTVACLTGGTNCPSLAGPDFDLGGSGPNLLPGLVGFGQKSGFYWALNPDNGNILWSTVVGPGGTLGGIEWGTATDGARIYAAIANSRHLPYTLTPGGQSVTGGSWAALDKATGKILWQTADPAGAIDPGSVSEANGVVYGGSFSGEMFAFDARTGAILWSFPSGGSVLDGPAIADGVLYWGTGYSRIRPGIGDNKLYAFSLPDR